MTFCVFNNHPWETTLMGSEELKEKILHHCPIKATKSQGTVQHLSKCYVTVRNHLLSCPGWR